MSLLYLSVLALASAQRLPVAVEPLPPLTWQQQSAFSCPHMTLRVGGYSTARPPDRPVEILVDGRSLRGARVEALRHDLASRAAVYRLGVLCAHDEASLNLFIHTGERVENGEIVFRTGVAFIRDGALLEYNGLEPTDADSFWFR